LNNLQDLFQQFKNVDLENQLEEGGKVSRKRLINALNYVNFQDGAILVNLKHPRYGQVISLEARPEPCLETTLRCTWTGDVALLANVGSYKFIHFLLAKDAKVILVKAEAKTIDGRGITFILPEVSYEVTSRRTKRHACQGIEAQLIQDGILFAGRLLDFSTLSFSVEVSAPPPQTFQWINSESTVYVLFRDKDHTLYSGDCRIIRQTANKRTRVFVLEPLHAEIRRFKPERFRSLRQKLSPSPHIVFQHPFTHRLVSAEVDDLSCSGLSAEEYHHVSTLFPGLIIPELNIEIARDFSIRCKAQVVYKTIHCFDEKTEYAKYGISILDMETRDQVNLSALLHRVSDRRFFVCSPVELDELWQLFFETGFVYPRKYMSIFMNKEKFKETYEKLYLRSPSIARHFVQRDKGLIGGHIAMIRFFENTWLIHHHAATPGTNAGIAVLDQVGRYIYDYHHLYSTHMDFVMCYFRPENKFPNRIFGGFASQLNDRSGCSVDPFMYFHFKGCFTSNDTAEWELAPVEVQDLIELKGFYEFHSGGLMLSALDLEPHMLEGDNLGRDYEALGFTRQRHLHVLKKRGELKAVIMVTVSDTGLNLSSLTNCVHIFVLEPEELSREVLYAHLSRLALHYEGGEFPVLIYPADYGDKQFVPKEKTYNLWVINSQFGDQYLEYMANLLHHPPPQGK
jgi:hypothetical protein